MNKPNIKVRGKVQELGKVVKNDQPRRSNFLLTVNTNQQYRNDDNLNNDIEVFEDTIKDLLNNIDQYVKLPEGDDWNDETIKDVNIDYVIEQGTKINSLHSHIILSFEHKTSVKLSYPKIKDKFKKDLGLKNVYIDNKIIKNGGNLNVLDYLNKYA